MQKKLAQEEKKSDNLSASIHAFENENESYFLQDLGTLRLLSNQKFMQY